MNSSARQIPRSIILTTAIVVAAALGWIAGTRWKSTAAQEERRAAAAADPARIASQARLRPVEAARREVDRIRAAGSAEIRERATIELVSSLTTAELAEWLQHGWFDLCDGFERTLFEQLAMHRWRREDPLAFAAWRRDDSTEEGAREEAYAAVAEWIRGDRERLQKYFADHPDEHDQARVLGAVAESHPNLALAMFPELLERAGGGARSHYRFRTFFNALAKSAPKELEGLFDSLQPKVRRQAEGALWVERLRESEEEALRALTEHPDGFQLLRENAISFDGIGNLLLREFESLPPSWRSAFAEHADRFNRGADYETWFETDYESLGLSSDEANAIRVKALRSLVHSNPAEFLGRLEEVEIEAAQREQMLRLAFERMKYDEEEYQAMLALLPTEEDREAVRSTVPLASREGPDEAATPRTPDGWLERAAGEDTSLARDNEFFSVPQWWTNEQFEEMAAGFRALQGDARDRVAQQLLNSIRSSWTGDAAVLRGEAVRHQVERFVGSDAGNGEGGGNGRDQQSMIRLSSEHAVHWGLNDPEAARAWVQTLPDGEVRRWAQRNLAVVWADYDPDAVAGWLGTLPAERRADVAGFMDSPDR